MTQQATLTLNEPRVALALFGTRDQHLHAIRDQLGVTITHRDGELRITGPEQAVTRATRALELLKGIAQRQGVVGQDDVARVLAGTNGSEAVPGTAQLDVMNSGVTIKPRTRGQARYLEAVRENALTLAIGPAGTGKTYLAVGLAVEALKQGEVRKIVLVRPAVEAGESLGFLPGDLEQKIQPYLRPLLDALHEMIDYEKAQQLREKGVIEVIPLAYMRGRTLNQAFIILDEAQNTTVAQMKMFLTRMGEQSKVVVSGDTSQVDLAAGTTSGLTDAARRLKGIGGIGAVTLSKEDIVRHRLVQEIVLAYEGPAGGSSAKKSNDSVRRRKDKKK